MAFKCVNFVFEYFSANFGHPEKVIVNLLLQKPHAYTDCADVSMNINFSEKVTFTRANNESQDE